MKSNPQPEFHPVTAERHASRWWHAPSSYSWAARDAVVPLVGSELARAALHLPVAFMRQHDAMAPFAVVGLEAGVSLFIAHDGTWTGGYVPAALRCRPFALVPTEDGRRVLCIDEQAGRVGADKGGSGQPFFSDEGKISPALQQFMDFLSSVESSRELTLKSSAALDHCGVLVPWEITIQTDSGMRRVDGLFRVDEEKLGQLDDQAFLELRKTGALALAYAQLLSAANLQLLGQRASARLAALQQPMTPVTASGDLDLSFLERGDTFRF
jgi:hypothetical protein